MKRKKATKKQSTYFRLILMGIVGLPLGLFSLGLVLGGVYYVHGKLFVAPRKEVKAMCQAIFSGMSLEQVDAVIASHEDSLEPHNYMGSYQTENGLIISRSASEWECFCSVTLEDDGTSNVSVEKTAKKIRCSATG